MAIRGVVAASRRPDDVLPSALDWRTVRWQASPATPGSGPLTSLGGVAPLLSGARPQSLGPKRGCCDPSR